MLPREDPRDAVVLPTAAGSTDQRSRRRSAWRRCSGRRLTIGTSSVRRIAQLSRLFPGARFAADPGQPRHAASQARCRRLRRARARGGRAATAGVRRAHLVCAAAAPCVPAPGQGIVAIEIRADDAPARRRSRGSTTRPPAAALTAERALVDALGGGCQTPIGALPGELRQRDARAGGTVISLDGSARRPCERAGAVVGRRQRWARASRRHCWTTGPADILAERAQNGTINRDPNHEASSTSSAPAPEIRGSSGARAWHCLVSADVVLYDHLVHPRLLGHARADAEKIDVGGAAPQPLEQEAICYLLAEKAREGQGRRAAEVGRSVRLRSAAAPKRSSCTSRASASRSCRAFRPASAPRATPASR